MAESTTATPPRSTISGARPQSRLRARAQFTTIMAAGRLAHWFVRGKKPQVNRQVVLETWDAVSDGAHNSNTDLTFWNGCSISATRPPLITSDPPGAACSSGVLRTRVRGIR
jgi:hypothetical protein